MNFQDIAVYLLVVGSIAYLFRTWRGSGKAGKGCGSCSSGGCAPKATSVPPAQQLIQIKLKTSGKVPPGS